MPAAWLAAAALLVAATAIAPSAVAQPVSGLYIAGAAGATLLQAESLRISGLPPGFSIPDYNNSGAGLVVMGSAGWGLGNGLRFEIEGQYLDHPLNGPSNVGSLHSGGTQNGYGLFANALYDFNVGLPFMYPYAGVGIGSEWTQLRNLTATGRGTALSANGTSNNFGYQGIVGLAFPISALPGLSVTAEYRLVGVLDPQQSVPVTTVSNGVTEQGKLRVGNEFDHEFLLGVRYAFATPPAPAPVAAPMPAPAAARTYLVFFDWDRYDLTERARQVIAQAASGAQQTERTRIEVNGFTDRSGTPAYNQALSVRRAKAVAAELVHDGVPQSAISVQGFGENNPLVPTADGVREAQNRRVEIILK